VFHLFQINVWYKNNVGIRYGATISAPYASRMGHTFDNWYKDPEFTSLWNFETDIVTEDTVLYAKWI